jgi:ABC-2 type transport system permease protein
VSSATKVPTEAPKGTVRGGLADLRAGLKQWSIWWTLPVERVKASYRRTYLGMLWMTLTTVVFVAGLSLLFGVLMGQDLKTFIPYVAIGFIGFTWMIGLINGGADSVTNNAASIQTTPGPLSVYSLQSLTQPTFQFLHDCIAIVLVIVIFQISLGWSLVVLPLALALILINGVAIGLWLGPLCAHYRDVGQLVDVLTRVLFFFTPVFWVTTDVDREQLVLLAGWNPLTYFLQLFRSPLLGEWPGIDSLVGALAWTVINVALGLWFFGRSRTRLAYWL